MGAMRFRRARSFVVPAVCVACALAAAAAAPHLVDAPVVWHEDDRRDIPQPVPRDPNVVATAVDETFFRGLGRLLNPVRLLRTFGTTLGGQPAHPAANPNALDEVPSSSWFTNRIGLFSLTPAEAARGPFPGGEPDTTAPLIVSSAKTAGVTPGFNVRDRRGNRYVIKFDPPGYPGMTSAADVITARILYAAGYNTPHDAIIRLRRDQLLVGEGVQFTTEDGEERVMTDADLDAILERVEHSPDGTWRALASRFLDGSDIGPFDWRGRRKDDPNDRVNHEDRRELRGFRMFAAWLCHYDTKQGNTLDMFVEQDGRHFVRHYFIDFASTLGAGALGPIPTACHEYSVDIGLTLGRTLALGLWQDPWRRIERPAGLAEIGIFQSESFHPMAFRPLEPNAAFANFTDRDGYWAAKIISAFSDAHLAALVAEGQYDDPAAAEWMVRVLGERRDAIARYFFDRIPPLDFFIADGSTLRFRDLGAERGVYPALAARYRYRVGDAAADGRIAWRGPWTETAETTLELWSGTGASSEGLAAEFVAAEVQVHRGIRWSPGVRVYAATASGRVVRLDR
jgi:hypothetical protein